METNLIGNNDWFSHNNADWTGEGNLYLKKCTLSNSETIGINAFQLKSERTIETAN